MATCHNVNSLPTYADCTFGFSLVCLISWSSSSGSLFLPNYVQKNLVSLSSFHDDPIQAETELLGRETVPFPLCCILGFLSYCPHFLVLSAVSAPF